MNKLIVPFMSLCMVTVIQGSENLKDWARKKTSIEIQTMKSSLTVPITAETTIAGVKQYLAQEEGIPAGQQRIDLLRRVPLMLYLGRERIADLHNEANVRQLMSDYNADTFELYLRVRSE